MKTLEDGPPVNADSDIRYNGRQASPNDPYVNRGYIPPSVLVKIRTTEEELRRSLTAEERAAMIKKLWR